jgi:class 3 adenylate cyclase/tetratricopeptide (TPR) repeat protein
MVLTPEMLRCYVPKFLASRFLARPAPLDVPGMERFRAAVLFADISGFTPLAERLAQRGPAGAEDLSGLLNAYFGQLTALIAAHTGEVITFAGDGLLAAWPTAGEDLSAPTWRAGQCALAVQAALHNYEVGSGLRLSLRIGVAAGDVMALHVGGVGGRWQLLLAGAPLIQASRAEQRASRGEVVLSPEAWELAHNNCKGQVLPGGYLQLTTADACGIPPAPARPPEELGEAALAYVPEVVRTRLAAGQGEWLAELRRVTPFFLNLLDVNPGAADLLEPLQLAMAVVQPILQQYEGSLKEVIVDDKGLTLVAVFGLPPLAHEDDPARAARAALVAQRALGELGMRCAIGLATGQAFCGAVGSDLHREYGTVGEVMNLAARLMQAAPGRILCDGATYRAARSHLTFQDLPAISVKGKAEPVAVYQPVEPTRRTDSPPAMLGRVEERAVLIERLRALKDGTSGLVVVDGEPGIGKSRLLADLLERAHAREVRSLAGAGDAIEKTTPYHAWRPVFAQLVDLAGVEDVEERRSRVLARVQSDPEMARLAPLFNSVLPLDLPDNELTAQLTGEVRADNTRELLVRFLQAAAAAPDGSISPLLVVLDDAHWFDSASWALARQVVAQVRPLLLVLATRPLVEPLPTEYRQLRTDAATEHLQLEPLSAHDTLALVCDRLGVRQLPEPVAALIEERAQGNPFFSEELAYALRDAGLIRITDGVCTIAPGTGDLSSVSFPDTMQGVVAGRIDRLPPGHELTLKVASVIGRLFALRIVHDVHPIEADKGALRGYLDDLQRQDFTMLDTPEPDLAYLFKHVVTQEVAYSLLLYAQRRQLHRAIAEWYEQAQAYDLPTVYPLLAYHWGRAEEPTKTLTYLELAGEQALRVGAYQEAVDLLTEAWSRSRAVQPAPDVLRQARWHRQLADAYEGLGRLPESRQHAERAVALLGRPVPATRLRSLGDLAGQALRHASGKIWPRRFLGGARTGRGGALEAARAYERLAILNYYASARVPGVAAVLHQVNLAERVGPSPELARAYGTMSVAAGVVQLHSLAGRYAQWAREIAREADDLPALAWVLETTCAFDISVGNWTAAREAFTEGLRIAQHLGDQRRWNELAVMQAQVLYHQGEFSRLAEWSAEMSAMASHADDPHRKAHVLLVEAWFLLPQGRTDAAVPRLQEATELLAGRGSRSDEILADGVLALAYLRRHDEERARLTARRAGRLIAQAQPTAVHIFEGYACVAEVYLSLWEAGDPAAARPARQACAALRQYARAIQIARPRAWLWQGLRAHLSGHHRRALAAWDKSLAAAERLAMPCERGRAHYQIGRHLPAGHPSRLAHLTRAGEIFADIGALHELAQVQAAMSPQQGIEPIRPAP